MSLSFPRQRELRLRKAPLAEVICQVRFPPILRIIREEPGEYQEVVRKRFPLLEVQQGFVLKTPGLGSPETPSAETRGRIYRFSTADRHTSISLAADFFAVSTSQYCHWPDFAADLALASEATLAVYQPAFASRIGLRFVNRLTHANTGTRDVEELWEMLRPELVAPLRSAAWSNPATMLCQLVLPDEPAKLTIRTAFGVEEDAPFLVLDFDYFEEDSLQLDDLLARCERYHTVIYDAFRWCIPEEKMIAFGPVEEEQ
jgi:uncharacterized protein (TIGR04255 family)